MPELKLISATLLGFLFKFVVAKWLSGQAVSIFNWIVKHYLVRYPREFAIWAHYDFKKKGLGHNYPNPIICRDGDCKII